MFPTPDMPFLLKFLLMSAASLYNSLLTIRLELSVSMIFLPVFFILSLMHLDYRFNLQA